MAADVDGSASSGQQPGDAAQQTALARAVGTRKSDEYTRLDPQVDAPQHGTTAQRHVQVADVEDGSVHGSLLARHACQPIIPIAGKSTAGPSPSRASNSSRAISAINWPRWRARERG